MVSSVYLCCNEDEEDPLHTLIKCINVQNIWRQAGVSNGNAQTFLKWWEDQGGILSKENMQLVAVIVGKFGIKGISSFGIERR